MNWFDIVVCELQNEMKWNEMKLNEMKRSMPHKLFFMNVYTFCKAKKNKQTREKSNKQTQNTK